MADLIRKTTGTFNKLTKLVEANMNKLHAETTVSYLINRIIVDSVLSSEDLKLEKAINPFSSANYEHFHGSLAEQELIAKDRLEEDYDDYLEPPVFP